MYVRNAGLNNAWQARRFPATTPRHCRCTISDTLSTRANAHHSCAARLPPHTTHLRGFLDGRATFILLHLTEQRRWAGLGDALHRGAYWSEWTPMAISTTYPHLPDHLSGRPSTAASPGGKTQRRWRHWPPSPACLPRYAGAAAAYPASHATTHATPISLHRAHGALHAGQT